MASVDDLLRRLHRQAASLRTTSRPDRQLPAHLRAWSPLARNTERILDALDPRPVDRELYGLLKALDQGGRGQVGRTDADLERLALTLGALGDVITSSPGIVAAAGQTQRTRLQTSIQAALHAAARTTLDIARTAGQEHAAETVRAVAEATEAAALLPPFARASTLERLTVPRLTPDTVDGAVQLWADVAQRTFTNYRLVTGMALQDAAATLALLCQTTADTVREAARRRILDPDPARDAARLLDQASAAWRQAAAWPASIQLGGRAYEHQRAVRAVQQALTGPALARLTLRERVHALWSAVSNAAEVGEFQVAAVTRVASQGGLWVAHERTNLRPPGVERRQVKYDWEILGAGHPAGRILNDRASLAQQSLLAAADATHRAIHPDPPRLGQPSRIKMVEGRIAISWWQTVELPTGTRRPEERAVIVASHHRPSLPR